MLKKCLAYVVTETGVCLFSLMSCVYHYVFIVLPRVCAVLIYPLQ